MGPKVRPEKRARKEDGVGHGDPIREDGCIGNYIQRIGVALRKDTGKYVVEMRPPYWKLKLNFGSYNLQVEAMIARDYGAFLRASTAEENSASAGGFGADDKLYQFEESPGIFEGIGGTMDRRQRIRPLYKELIKEKWSGEGNPPHHQFCKDARKDIDIAIGVFRERFPERFSPPTETEKGVAKVEPVDGGIHCASSSSNPKVRVPPEPALGPVGREDGAIAGGVVSPWADLQISVAMNGSPSRILLDMKVPPIDDQHIFLLLKACFDKVKDEMITRCFEKFLEELVPCPYDPLSIPAIDLSEDPKT
ncbi:hypothetical protein M758_1G080000 [Ceratodon purpureus]|uniref:Uncharacterized protein n=1 Tax=Ceratodon purpureus TaxID=3225 RepID=A0A8T0J2R5_CERPU|nr:hypothetical protein KC19_1G081800 [Ceratodon purpureus]KAG0629145.1 hypothetical protein M758_1G080000 [Ceratodon purpureus]